MRLDLVTDRVPNWLTLIWMASSLVGATMTAWGFCGQSPALVSQPSSRRRCRILWIKTNLSNFRFWNLQDLLLVIKCGNLRKEKGRSFSWARLGAGHEIPLGQDGGQPILLDGGGDGVPGLGHVVHQQLAKVHLGKRLHWRHFVFASHLHLKKETNNSHV